jgi:HopA1 effector protein family
MSGPVFEQVSEIAARVRIRSMTDLDFAGRQIEVPPPLPRRFPALPMVDWLQSELYQKAYCLSISEVESTEQAYPPAANDMRDALAAANATRTRIDRDWLVTETDPAGAVTVTKRGMVRRIPVSEIVTSEPPSGSAIAGGVFAQPGPAARHPRAGAPFQGTPGVPAGPMRTAPPQPGKLVAIALPRERADEGGFYFAFGETVASTIEGRPVVRFYWNVPADSAPEFMSKLTSALNVRSVAFTFKCPLSSAGYLRRDTATLYIARTAHDAAVPASPRSTELS